ncbi:MAG: translation initiation factor IF-2 [bacterium JZ-2024 1]
MERKVLELAKELGIASREIIDILQKQGFSVKSQLNKVPLEAETALRELLSRRKREEEERRAAERVALEQKGVSGGAPEEKAVAPKSSAPSAPPSGSPPATPPSVSPTATEARVRTPPPPPKPGSGVKRVPAPQVPPPFSHVGPREEAGRSPAPPRPAGPRGTSPPRAMRGVLPPAQVKPAKPATRGRKEKEKEKEIPDNEDRTIGAKVRETLKIVKHKGQTASPVTPPIRRKSYRLVGGMTASEVSQELGIGVPDILSQLMKKTGQIIPQNRPLSDELIRYLADCYDITIEVVEKEATWEFQDDSREDRMKPRPPVVAVMGHVDHGKTLLLDTIRKTNVAEREAGGITQRIGAYQVSLQGKRITFIDTPGHRAFTEMRLHGAKVTDIGILVVAADEGVMPQTREALAHIRAAGVELVVALNKIDRPNAQPELVMTQLSELGVTPIEWGGDTFFVKVSAKTGEGIPELLETILTLAELKGLKADPQARVRGTVIEASQSRELGKFATIIIQQGSLKLAQFVVLGHFYFRVKAMVNDVGKNIKEAPPSFPVRIFALPDLPRMGDMLFGVKDEKEAQTAVEALARKSSPVREPATVGMESLLGQKPEEKELRIVLKASTHGMLEALKKELEELKVKVPEGMTLTILNDNIGDVTTSDVHLAAASQAIIFGYDVGADAQARKEASSYGVQVRIYDVIFHLVDDVRKALAGLLEPVTVEEEVGEAEVKQVFRQTAHSVVAGVRVRKGMLLRGAPIAVFRNGTEIFKGPLTSLRRFTEDVDRVGEGYECGIALENFSDLEVGDTIRCYKVSQIREGEAQLLGTSA